MKTKDMTIKFEIPKGLRDLDDAWDKLSLKTKEALVKRASERIEHRILTEFWRGR